MCLSNLNDLAFTTYISFMSSLIDHPDDVKELRLKNIILNTLGRDQEVAKLFTEIPTHSMVDFEIYRDVKEKFQEHYNSIIRTWIAGIIHIYFSSPWAFIAFLAGASVIVLTFVQTYFTIFPLLTSAWCLFVATSTRKCKMGGDQVPKKYVNYILLFYREAKIAFASFA